MTAKQRKLLRAFAVELVVYALLVTVYFYAALHFLGGWLKHLFDSDKPLYAFVALGLIIGQGVALEVMTTWLLLLFRKKIH